MVPEKMVRLPFLELSSCVCGKEWTFDTVGLNMCIRGREWTFDSSENGKTSSSKGWIVVFKLDNELLILQIMARVLSLGFHFCVRAREWTFDSPGNGETSSFSVE